MLLNAYNMPIYIVLQGLEQQLVKRKETQIM